MKTAEEIFEELKLLTDRHDYERIKVIKAMKLYANQKLDEAIIEFERLKPAESLRDIMYLDGVKSVIDSLKDKL